MPQAGTQSPSGRTAASATRGTTNDKTETGLATGLRISVSRLARRLRVERIGLGETEAVLSDIQLAALAALERHGSMTPGELADHEKVQPPSMTRVIAVLEERSLVMRAPHPTDRRQVVLTVTEDGRALVQRVRRRKDAWLARRLAELTAEERATLRAAVPILEKLSQSLAGRPEARVRRAPRCLLPASGRQRPARQRAVPGPAGRAQVAPHQVHAVGRPRPPPVGVEGRDELGDVGRRAAPGQRQV